LVRECDLVVNATSVGLRDDAMPIEPSTLRSDAAVLDLVYRRGETAWVRAARARGLRARDGLVMLIEQGAAAFEQWFGFPPDRDAMWSAVR
jgi:shikimate dehydrogenase